MAKGEDNTFVAVVNDTDPKNGGKVTLLASLVVIIINL